MQLKYAGTGRLVPTKGKDQLKVKIHHAGLRILVTSQIGFRVSKETEISCVRFEAGEKRRMF